MNIDYIEFKNQLDNIKVRKNNKTFLAVLNKTYNEVLISKYLAYFLDEHNTSREVVKQILLKTATNSEADFASLIDCATLQSINTEEKISADSQLDIIIRYSTFWIVIENKIWAGESKQNQTGIYEKQLAAINQDNLPIKFIYLKPYFNKSKASNQHFAELYYDDLIDILSDINADELPDQGDYKFLQDFIKHSQEHFMKNKETIIDDTAIQFYLSNQEKLDYIINTYNLKSRNLLSLILEKIEEAFPTYLTYHTNAYIQIYKGEWKNQDHAGIHFEILAKTNKMDSLLSSKPVKFTFALHNERTTKDILKNIKHNEVSYVKTFMFDSEENILLSVQSIIKELQSLKDKFEAHIDNEVANNKKAAL